MPAGNGVTVQVPVPGWQCSAALQGPAPGHEETTQHTPSTQRPLKHAPPSVHGSPLPSAPWSTYTPSAPGAPATSTPPAATEAPKPFPIVASFGEIASSSAKPPLEGAYA